MKIGLVTGPFIKVPPDKYGGGERVIYYLAKGLMRLGHDVYVFASSDSNVEGNLVPYIEKAKENEGWRWDFKSKIRYQRYLIQLDKSINTLKERLDIINFHALFPEKRVDYPCLCTLRNPIDGYELSDQQLHYLFFNSISKSQGILAKNKFKKLTEINIVGNAYNGLDPDSFTFVNKPENYLCFLGRFDEQKMPHLAIALALRWKMKIKIAGKIDLGSRGYFDKFIKPYLNNPSVEFLGELGFNEKINLLSKSIANLHPLAVDEAFGLTILESAYCGTPTVAINRGSIPEVIIDNKTGLIVDDFDLTISLLDRVKKLDRKYVCEYSRKKFNYMKMAREYIKLYSKVIKKYTHPVCAR